MITDGADFGSFLAKVDMAAVGADPNFLFASLKDLAFLQVGQQLAVSLLMLLLDLALIALRCQRLGWRNLDFPWNWKFMEIKCTLF